MATAKKLDSGSWRCLAFIGMENGKRKYKSFTAPTKKNIDLPKRPFFKDSTPIFLHRVATFKNIMSKEALNYLRKKVFMIYLL